MVQEDLGKIEFTQVGKFGARGPGVYFLLKIGYLTN